MKIWNDVLEIVTPEVWSNCVLYMDEIILDWKDQVCYDEHPELIIHIEGSSDEEENVFPSSNED